MSAERLIALDPTADTRWPCIIAAHKLSIEKAAELRVLVYDDTPLVSPETPFVVYGSLARREFQPGSDLDWTLLVDGQVDDGHAQSAIEVEKALQQKGFVPPGPTGTFGELTFSHDLVHRIGGVSDDNVNTTRRVLLLLESLDIGDDSVVTERVKTAILKRYVDQDVPLKSRKAAIPRFLLNDVIRFWRTMAVDYASKTWERNREGWALRNVKLRISRKLLYVKGLLVCFDYALSHETSAEGSSVPAIDLNNLRNLLEETPLERLASFGTKYKCEQQVGILIDEYEKFLRILATNGNRTHLKTLSYEAAAEDPLFQEFREISHAFQGGLMELFFNSNEELSQITKEYGVF